jgi:iron(III) transport system substrate-binding protein
VRQRASPAGGTGRRFRRLSGTLLILFVTAGLAAACADVERADRPSGEVVLYTSIPDPVVDRLQGVVERRFPDLDGDYWVPIRGEAITLRVVRGRTGDIQRLIEDEVESGGIKADVIWLAEPSPYETYKDMGLLAPYQAPSGAPIRSTYIDPDGFYVAGRIISMVIAWNTDLQPDGFTDWPDLHKAGTTAFPGPESGAARATIQALLDKYGPSYFEILTSSGGVSVPSNGAARDGLAARRYEAVAVLDYMVRQAKDSGLPLDYTYPAGGTVLIPSPLAITADAQNPDAAKAFIDFILSQSGQKIVVEIGSFYPVRSDVDPPAGAPALNTIDALSVNWEALALNQDAIRAFWEECWESPGAAG